MTAFRTTPIQTPTNQGRPRHRPAAPLVMLGVLGLVTGAAFAGGAHLRARFTERLVGGHAGLAGTRLAQAELSAGRHGVLPGATAASPAQNGAVTPVADHEDDAAFLNAVGLFDEVYATVKDAYVDKLPEQTKMAQGAVKAMVAELNDPNCRFVEPAERTAIESQAKNGRFEGIGAVLRVVGTPRDGYTEHKITVVTVLPGSPAEKAGLRAGDVVSSVDGKYVLTAADPFASLNRVAARIKSGEATEDEVEKASEARDALFQRVQSGMTLEKAIRALSVGENEKRTLVVQRAGVKTPLTLGLTTATTRVPDPSNRTLAGGVDYVRLPAFDDTTAKFVTLALANAGGRDSGGGAAGIVLDLRDNPGGPLPFVQSVAGALLRAARPNAAANTGRLFTLVGPKNKRIGLTATGAAAASTGTTRPLVVLVNQGTAGEAEALAAALRDKGAAILMGAKTFGDPLVRTLFPLADGSGFLLTTGKLVGATGADWQNAGLAPTIVLAAGTSEERVLARAASVAASAAARSEVAHAAAPIDVDPSR